LKQSFCIVIFLILESQDPVQFTESDPSQPNTVYIYEIPAVSYQPEDQQQAVPCQKAEESIILDNPVQQISDSTSVPYHRQWAGRSRRRMSKPVVTSSDAAAKIGDLVDEKKSFYKRKLEIDNEEHDAFMKKNEAEMRVLALKEQYYSKKLKMMENEN
jgi:hypothetical protein